MKRYSKLALKGFKVIIIGDNWDKSLLSNNINIEIENNDYFNKNKILNNAKIFLNLSLIEGGPVTIIEAIASGCKVITKDNGNGYNLSLIFQVYVSELKILCVLKIYLRKLSKYIKKKIKIIRINFQKF